MKKQNASKLFGVPAFPFDMGIGQLEQILLLAPIIQEARECNLPDDLVIPALGPLATSNEVSEMRWMVAFILCVRGHGVKVGQHIFRITTQGTWFTISLPCGLRVGWSQLIDRSYEFFVIHPSGEFREESKLRKTLARMGWDFVEEGQEIEADS